VLRLGRSRLEHGTATRDFGNPAQDSVLSTAARKALVCSRISANSAPAAAGHTHERHARLLGRLVRRVERIQVGAVRDEFGGEARASA
jgi:hypothetical protein